MPGSTDDRSDECERRRLFPHKGKREGWGSNAREEQGRERTDNEIKGVGSCQGEKATEEDAGMGTNSEQNCTTLSRHQLIKWVNQKKHSRENSSGGIVTGETGLAHAGTVVDNQGGNFVFHIGKLSKFVFWVRGKGGGINRKRKRKEELRREEVGGR